MRQNLEAGCEQYAVKAQWGVFPIWRKDFLLAASRTSIINPPAVIDGVWRKSCKSSVGILSNMEERFPFGRQPDFYYKSAGRD